MKILTTLGLILTLSTNAAYAATCQPKSKADLKNILVSSGDYTGRWRGTNNSSGKLILKFQNDDTVIRRYQGFGRWNKDRLLYEPTSATKFSIIFGNTVWHYELRRDCSVFGLNYFADDKDLPVRSNFKPKKR